MTRVGWGGGGGGGGGYTVQFCYKAPSGQRIQEVLHPHVCLSVYRFRCVREAPPPPPPGLRHLFHPHKNWQWYGLALVSWAAAFGTMYNITCFAERRFIILLLKYTFVHIYVNSCQFQTVSSLKISVLRKLQTFLLFLISSSHCAATAIDSTSNTRHKMALMLTHYNL